MRWWGGGGALRGQALVVSLTTSQREIKFRPNFALRVYWGDDHAIHNNRQYCPIMTLEGELENLFSLKQGIWCPFWKIPYDRLQWVFMSKDGGITCHDQRFCTSSPTETFISAADHESTSI